MVRFALLLVLLAAWVTTGCGDLLNPQSQVEKGVYDKVVERYDAAPGMASVVSKPKYPGLKKRGSIKVDILDNSDEEKVKEVVGQITAWYAEESSRLSSGLVKLYVYALLDGEPKWVGVFVAGAPGGEDITVQAPSESNLPKASEKA